MHFLTDSICLRWVVAACLIAARVQSQDPNLHVQQQQMNQVPPQAQQQQYQQNQVNQQQQQVNQQQLNQQQVNQQQMNQQQLNQQQQMNQQQLNQQQLNQQQINQQQQQINQNQVNQHQQQQQQFNQGQQNQQLNHQQQQMNQQQHQQFGEQNAVHDQEHINQHLQDRVDVDTSKMTPEQLQFHYFKMHDTDGNNKLDGLELIQAITHVHDENNNAAPPPRFKDQELEDMVDSILKDDDYNDDGLIDYSEFLRSQQRGNDPPPPQGEAPAPPAPQT